MKLYHCQMTRSIRVLWCLEEMKLDYDLEIMPFPPRVMQKSFKEINPLGTVPYFVDGDVAMSESCAICHYLATRYGDGSLIIKSGHEDYGKFLDWMYYSDATITFPQAVILRYTMLEPPERQQPQVVEDYKAFLAGRLKKLEQGLEGKTFLCAERFTIADICVGFALIFSQKVLHIDDIFTPNIKAYYERLELRPAFQKATSGSL